MISTGNVRMRLQMGHGYPLAGIFFAYLPECIAELAWRVARAGVLKARLSYPAGSTSTAYR